MHDRLITSDPGGRPVIAGTHVTVEEVLKEHPPPTQPDCLGYARDDGPGHEARELALGQAQAALSTPSLPPSQALFPKPSPQGTPEALLSPILRRMSSPSARRAAPGAGALRRGGGAALGAWEEPPAGGAVGGAGGCAPGAGAKCSLKFLYVSRASRSSNKTR